MPPDVGLFWDYENIKRPRTVDTYTVCTRLRDHFRDAGRLCERRLYYDSRKQAEVATDREGFDMSGFTLVDCPTRNRKEMVDKKIIVDVMSFAWERLRQGGTPPLVVLLTSDGDYAYMLNRLRDFGVQTALVYDANAHAALVKSADRADSWRFDVLGLDEAPREDDPGWDAVALPVPPPLHPSPVPLLLSEGALHSDTASVASTTATHPDDRERFLVLLVAVQTAQRARVDTGPLDQTNNVNTDDWTACWAYEADVGSLYHKQVAHTAGRAERRRTYKRLRTDAFTAGLLTLARKCEATGELVASGPEGGVEGAATVLVRLTAEGVTALG